MRNGKTSSEVEAYRIALEAIGALHFGNVSLQGFLMTQARQPSSEV
jgi:hypothetical protein